MAWQVDKQVVRSARGIVAAQSGEAAEVGAEVLRAGGNAVDAAIATSLALDVVEPWMSGLGGGGCMLVWLAEQGRAEALDFGMIAPRALDPSAYPLAGGTAGDLFGWPAVVEDRNLHGPLAVAVPGQAEGLSLAHERFASMPFAELAAPAIALAEAGLKVDWYASQLITNAARELRRYPGAAASWLPDDLPPAPPSTGDTLRLPLPGLADTLRELAAEGPRSFYEGGLARRLLADCQALGVPIEAADLAAYRGRVAAPLAIDHRGARLVAMPGLYAGVSLARCLELLARENLGAGRPGHAAFAAYARALLQAYRERLESQGDGGDGITPSCTSHFCVVDRHGNLVALTQTLLSTFGSKLLAPGTGILLNNGIMWFDPRPGRPNSIQPGRRPLSNMCPVIGLADGRRFALGASGGRRILPAVLQLASFLTDFAMSLEAAFHQPRLDASGTDLVTLDARLGFTLNPAELDGIPVRSLPPQPSPLLFACPSAVLHDEAEGLSFGMTEIWQPWADAVAEA
jgi:gamma-glutamyltranspeptidase/glutathione hydrolase